MLRPKETLQRLCDHLGVTCFGDYIEKCIKILYGTPSFTGEKQSCLNHGAKTARHKNDEKLPFSERIFI